MRQKCGIENAPGLEWRTRKSGERVPIWTARRSLVSQGYKPSTQNLGHLAADPDGLAAACRRLQADMLEWAANKNQPARRSAQFAGTLGSLIDLYLSDPNSPYFSKKYNTQACYSEWLKPLRKYAGNYQLSELNGSHFRSWYNKLSVPAAPGAPPRLRRAYGAIQVLRIIFKFGVTRRLPNCAELSAISVSEKFSNVAPRKVFLDYHGAKSIIAMAHKLGRPEMALAQALQFELTLRQKDVIGEWIPSPSGNEWCNGLTWEHIDSGGVLRKRTTKTGAPAEHSLRLAELVAAELERWPEAKRVGPMIVNTSTGRPFASKSYAKLWRSIARAAGIDDRVQNRDSRAGGITEGSDAGASLEHLRLHASHSNVDMTKAYNRTTLPKTDEVKLRRSAHRKRAAAAASNAVPTFTTPDSKTHAKML